MNLVSRLFKGDRIIWIVFTLLFVISIVEVFSAASFLSYKTGNYWAPITRHVIILIVGVVIVLILQNVPYRLFKLLPYILLPVSIIMLLWVFAFGEKANDASRWFTLGGFQFQPSELAKMAVITSVALILSQNQEERGTSKKAMGTILWVTVIMCLFIAPENLSTAIHLFGVIYLMMIIGRLPARQMWKLTGTLLVVGGLVMSIIIFTPKSFYKDNPVLHRVGTWQDRITSFFVSNDAVPPAKYDIQENEQRAHANIAIATSHIFGKMPGNSVERDFLAQAFSDFIFAIIIEELGLVGGVLVVFFYIVLLVRAGRIAQKCESSFAAFLALGVALIMVSQAIINMMVAVGLFPITGQTLPLISRGGTSIIINCAYIGILLSISRYAENRAEAAKAVEQQPTNNNQPNDSVSEYDEIEEVKN